MGRGEGDSRSPPIVEDDLWVEGDGPGGKVDDPQEGEEGFEGDGHGYCSPS